MPVWKRSIGRVLTSRGPFGKPFPLRRAAGVAAGRKARSSVEEHYLDTVGVSGSIPLVPTAAGRRSSSIPTTSCRTP